MLRIHRRLGLAVAAITAALTATASPASAVTVDAVVFSGHTDAWTCASGPIPAVSCPGVPLIGGNGGFDWVSGGGPSPISCETDTLSACGMHMAGKWIAVDCGAMELVAEVDGTFMPNAVDVIAVFVEGIGVLAGSDGTTVVSGVFDVTPTGTPTGTNCGQGLAFTGVLVVA